MGEWGVAARCVSPSRPAVVAGGKARARLRLFVLLWLVQYLRPSGLFSLASFDSSVEPESVAAEEDTMVWSDFLELLSGGLRRLVSVSPIGPNGCRAPAPSLQS
jgi:hypothetical protein